jgi:hypothetical protein
MCNLDDGLNLEFDEASLDLLFDEKSFNLVCKEIENFNIELLALDLDLEMTFELLGID